jgi:lambda family phage portal protein
MGTLAVLRRWFGGGTGIRAARNEASLYDAGSTARRTRGWPTITTRANDAILANLATLRDRSRHADRNDGFAKSAINKLVSNIVGISIKPQSQADDLTLRAQIDALWLRWTDEADADGLLDFYGLQGQAVRTWLTAGECFTRIRGRLPQDGLSVSMQVQNLEPELCPYSYNFFSSTSKVRAGIQFNGIGRRVAYFFYPSRPELDDFDTSTLNALPADLVVHLFNPIRPGQLRGEPHLTPALVALNELDQYQDATLVRQKLSALFAGFIKRPPATGDLDEINPLTGAPTETDEAGRPMVSLEPGIMQELDPGEEVSWSEPPDPGSYPDFMRQGLLWIAAATGVPYEVLTGDMRGVNDRTVRVLLHEFRRFVQALQGIVIFQFCRPIWRAWLDTAVLTGALPIPAAQYFANPEPWTRVVWVPHGWPYINPVQDVEANKAAVRSGFKARSAVISEQGDDAEAIDAQQAVDQARADSLKLIYDTDARKTSTTGLTQARPAGSALPDDGSNPANDGASA